MTTTTAKQIAARPGRNQKKS